MGTPFEFNDTLMLRHEQGFPKELKLEEHMKNSATTVQLVNGRRFSFWKLGRRIYQGDTSRAFLVEGVEKDGQLKWLYWGHCAVLEQRVIGDRTEGVFVIIKVYDPEYQRLVTINESPAGKSYF